MKCEEIEVQISALIDGELDEAGQSLVHEHLAQCESCRRTRDAFAGVGDLFRARQEEDASIPSPTRIIQDAGRGGRLISFSHVRRIAAALALLAGVTALIQYSGREPVEAPPAAPTEGVVVTDLETDLPGATLVVYKDLETDWLIISVDGGVEETDDPS